MTSKTILNRLVAGCVAGALILTAPGLDCCQAVAATLTGQAAAVQTGAGAVVPGVVPTAAYPGIEAPGFHIPLSAPGISRSLLTPRFPEDRSSADASRSALPAGALSAEGGKTLQSLSSANEISRLESAQRQTARSVPTAAESAAPDERDSFGAVAEKAETLQRSLASPSASPEALSEAAAWELSRRTDRTAPVAAYRASEGEYSQAVPPAPAQRARTSPTDAVRKGTDVRVPVPEGLGGSLSGKEGALSRPQKGGFFGFQGAIGALKTSLVEGAFGPILRRLAVAAGVRPGDGSGRASRLVRKSEAFLDELQRRAFLYFLENTNPDNGLTKDRADNFGGKDERPVASIAAVGYSLVALGIARSRGWISGEQAYQRTLTTLRHFRYRQPQVRGWFYHFIDQKTGERVGRSELSSIDTALFLVGAIFAGRYFPGTEAARLADEIYRRVDFRWMMTDGGSKPGERTLSMGWTPEGGFLKDRWHEYSEHMILYLLGLGSPTHSLPPQAWDAWKRPVGSYGGHRSIAAGPLFIHQYSHMAIDFRGLRDRHADYYANSVNATLSNRKFAIDQMAQYRTYGPDSWGLTASDGPDGYRAYGAPPGYVEHDGTVSPAAAGGSIVFTPKLSLRALRFFLRTYGSRIWGRYGFSAAFNTDPRWKDRFNAPGMWRSPDAVGIDLGTLMLMIENLRTGLVWETIMGSPYVQQGLEKAGFKKKSQG